MSKRSPAITYELPSGNARRSSRAALLACGLGVLQACSSADAVAPTSAPLAAAAPARISRIVDDTAVVGSSLVLEGEQLPTNPAVLRATLDGIPLTVQSVSATRLELVLPVSGFVCAAPRAVALRVQLPTSLFEATVPLRVAQRLALAPGESVTLAGKQPSRCVELHGALTGASARYLVAVVNGSPSQALTQNNALRFELRGIGTGTVSNVSSVVSAPAQASVSNVAGFATGEAPRATSAPVQASLSGDGANHGARLEKDLAHVRVGGNAVAAWQAVRSGASRAPAIVRALEVGDVTTLNAMSSSCHVGQSVRARVVYAGARAVVLEDVTAPRAGSMDVQYRQLGAEFDAVVYPLLAQQVGNPLAMNGSLEGDGRVTMLFTRFVNDSLPGTAGFVSACNFYPRKTFGASNQDEVLYARVAGVYETPEEWRRAMRATVVHEAKHLASFAERLSRGNNFEEPWLEEATARVAEELYSRTFDGGGAWKQRIGFTSSVGCELVQCDDRPLIMWKHFSGLHAWLRTADVQPAGQILAGNGAALSATSANAGYSSGWALVRYTLDQFAGSEADVLRDLVTGRVGEGTAALAAVAQRSEAELMALWALSLGELGMQTNGGGSSSWQMSDILTGMSNMFPGVFVAQPLTVPSASFGNFALPAKTLTGTASYLAVGGELAGAGQIIELRASGVGGTATVGFAVRRTQ